MVDKGGHFEEDWSRAFTRRGVIDFVIITPLEGHRFSITGLKEPGLKGR
jgi:hypothetical protein